MCGIPGRMTRDGPGWRCVEGVVSRVESTQAENQQWCMGAEDAGRKPRREWNEVTGAGSNDIAQR
eukprot:362009-Chlamydomonas_euryale.AAC.19